MNIPEKLQKLRHAMKAHGMTAYLITSCDDHQSEYVPEHFRGRAFMSGFTGSAGTLLVTKDAAYLWTDGRYFIQAQSQLTGSGIALMKQGEKGVPTVAEFIADKINGTLGADGRTVSASFISELAAKKPELGYILGYDLLDEVWTDRPPLGHSPVWVLADEYSGESAADKLKRVREKTGGSALVLSSLDDIAWLFNIRAEDIAYNPVALAFAIVFPDHAEIFAGKGSLSPEVQDHFASLGAAVSDYEGFAARLGSSDIFAHVCDIRADEKCLSAVYMDILEKSGKNIIKEPSPVQDMKARKNRTEQENIRKAHITDGVAVTKLIYRLKTEYAGRCGELTETGVSDMLEELRQKGDKYLYQSFEPISAYGANAAIVHYSADEQSNTRLDDKGFLLLDTGGQYLCGTTDITRTVALGELTHEQKQAYTAVLKGNLRLAAERFREGCSGVNLDILARQPLWELGLDFNHGTGHGVGYCLNVHEGPQGIRMRDRSPAPFAEGMLTSDEPGVYIEGEFGIRLENLMLCVRIDEKFLGFETVTMVPFDRSAILTDDLTPEDAVLLDAYHSRVYEAISPYLDDDERGWLRAETAPVLEG